MSETCFPLIRGRAMRVTRLNSCGEVVLGPDSKVESEGFVSVAFTANTDTGDTITVIKANGKKCVNDVPTPEFNGYTVELTFCGVDPDLWNMLTGQQRVYSAQVVTDAVGVRINTDVDLGGFAFALELWSTVPGEACADGEEQFGYLLLPFIKGGVLGDFTVENGAISFVVTGAVTKDGNGWGTGPYNVVPGVSGAPAPLATSLAANDHLHLQVTNVAPPAEVCGASAIGVPATLITAGIPATLTPANSYTPLNLAALIAAAPTKSPTTAWTTGQYVLLRDGSKAHWSGTAWVAGAA